VVGHPRSSSVEAMIADAADSHDSAAAAPPRLAPGVELIGQFTGSGFREATYIARRSDGQVVHIGELFFLVAQAIDGKKGYDEIARCVTERAKLKLDGELARYIVEDKLRSTGLVADRNGAPPKLRRVDPLLALRFRVGVVPEHVVHAITTVLWPLFLPVAVISVLTGLVVVDVWLFGFHGIAQSLRQTLYDPAFVLLVLGLVILSAAFHECGHATACRYGGARPGRMGVGLYLVWPAFYTDVTDAYRLGKAGRLRTDLGGVYFNCIFILLTAGVYFATGFEPLLLMIPLQHAQMLHQFLPVVRLDGYYIVSDLAGVPDMFMRIGPTMKSLLPWHEPDRSVKELKPWVRVVVTAYVLTVVPLLLFVLVITLINMPRVLATTWDSGLIELEKIQEAFRGGSAFPGVVGSIQLLILALIPVGLLLMFAQLGRRLAARAWGATENRPAARAGVVAVAVATAAFAAYAWVPSSVYRPIQPGEKGTLAGALEQFAAIPSGRPALPEGRARELGNAPFRSDSVKPRVPANEAPASRPGTRPSRNGPGANKPATPGATPTPPGPSGSTEPPSGAPAPRGVPAAPPRTLTSPSGTLTTPVTTLTTPTVTATTPTLPVPTTSVPTLPLPTVSVPTVPLP
jgi:putative peptide zinc metalloprotease protein